jgi:hypothetical protein
MAEEKSRIGGVMLLKRIYEHSSGHPVLDHIKLLRAGPRQRFSTGLVEAEVEEGWMVLSDEKITLKTKPKAVYLIERKPGYYCCHCGDLMLGSLEAQAHVKDEHAGKKSPDAFNPSGYERIHYYDCVKEE